MNQSNWIWMPHPGHLIVASHCRFHLNTYVNDHIVSTVGEWVPSETEQYLFANLKGITLEGKGDAREAYYVQKMGYQEIGAGRTYETMVFTARDDESVCCPYSIRDYRELDMQGYNDPGEAYHGHLDMCKKYSQPYN